MKEETVVGVLLRFLQGEEARKASLISKKGDGGKMVLESHGVPIAKWGEGEVVVKRDDMTPVRRKHRKWLEVVALEKGIKIVYESQKGE